MNRKLALVTTLLAAAVGAGTAAAQATAPAAPKPAAAAKADTGTKSMSKTTAKTAAKPAAAPATRHAAWTKDQIKEAQEGLTKAGYYKGKISGIMNADTRKALRAYQKQEKLPVTGRLSDDVLAKLKSA
jgi:His-Xaa-Ser repeat protein HxsA